MSVEAKLGPGPEFGVPKALFPVRIVHNAMGTDEFVTTPGGQHFLATNAVSAAQGQQSLTVVVNWTAELGKRLPSSPLGPRRPGAGSIR